MKTKTTNVEPKHRMYLNKNMVCKGHGGTKGRTKTQDVFKQEVLQVKYYIRYSRTKTQDVFKFIFPPLI